MNNYFTCTFFKIVAVVVLGINVADLREEAVMMQQFNHVRHISLCA
jgi:hypothetical protein